MSLLAARAARIAAAVLLVALALAGALRPAAADEPWGRATHSRGETKFFQNVTVAPGQVVDGNLNVVFGDAHVAGTVHGDVNTLFGTCTIADGAVIDGEQNCVAGDAARALLPSWVGTSTSLGQMADQDRRIMTKLAGSAVVLLVFLLFPLRMRLALDRVERHPGIAAAVGTLAAVALVPIAIVLLLSIVGIPLIAVEVAALFAGIWLGQGAVALLVGRRLCELVLPAATPSPLLALVLGLVVVSAAEIIPVLGWIVTAIVWLVGLGAAILSFLPSTPVGSAPRWPIGGPPMNRPA